MSDATTNNELKGLRDSSDQMQQKECNPNFIGIWFHDKNSLPYNVYETMMMLLKSTFQYIRIFDQLLQLTSYLLKDALLTNVVVIVSSAVHGPSICELVEQQPKREGSQIKGPYVFLFEKTNTPFKHRVFTSITELFIKIESDLQGNNSQHLPATTADSTPMQTTDKFKKTNVLPPFGIINSSLEQNSIRLLSNESLKFIQFQTLIEILLRMQHDDQRAKNDMLSDCRIYYQKQNNIAELRKIQEFAEKYTAGNVILYWTDDSFCYRMVNRAFRSEDIEQIFCYRLFITDLHKELARQANEKRNVEENIIVYRGKKLPNIILQQLKDNKEKLISINGFLATTRKKKTAIAFSGDNIIRDNHSSVVFELHVQKHSDYTGKPFVDISSDGDEMDDEQEVLFSVGTVWRIDNIWREDHLWYIKLTTCDDLDDDLHNLLASLVDGYTLLSIGNLLQELGENEKAENFYGRMLENEPNITDEQKGILYFRIGMLRVKKKYSFEALDALNKALPYFPSSPGTCEKPSASKDMLTDASTSERLAIYFHIGLIHHFKKNWKEAQEALEHASAEDGSRENLAKINSYLGELVQIQGDYEQAETYCKKALDLINASSAKEDVKTEFKRKFEETQRLSDKIDESSRSKRQRTIGNNE